MITGITIQWTPQNSNVYRVDGYYLEEIGTQKIIWQGSADTTQVTVQATKGYSGHIRLDTVIHILLQEKHITVS